MKRCSHCKEHKPLSEFYRNKGQFLDLTLFCKPCFRASTKSRYSATGAAERLEEWRRKNPERYRLVRQGVHALERAVRTGQIQRGTQCEDCGTARRIQAAHYDYSQPIKVRWLCRSCHSRWDAAQPKTAA